MKYLEFFENQNLWWVVCIIFGLWFSRCSSVERHATKLDLSEEKEIILQDRTIGERQKNFIIKTFEKSETICKENLDLINELYEKIEKQKKRIEILDEQAKVYRYVRNILLGLLLSYIAYRFRDTIFSLIKLVRP